MASLAVMTTVSGIVSANWTHTPIIDPNTTGGVPADNSAFLEILYPLSTERQISFGATTNHHEEFGGARIGVFIPAGVGINPTATPWYGRIETLMQQFRGKFINNTEFLGFTGPTVEDGSDDGAYYEISFVLTYRRISLA